MYIEETDIEEAQDGRRSLIFGIIIAIAILSAGAYGVMRMMKHSSIAPPPREQKITVLPREQPPPPPPPPKQEPPPEEQKIEQQVPEEKPVENTPDQADNEPPPGDDLGVDAAGNGSGDGFGLVGKKGGRGLIGGGDRNRWYAGLIQRDLQSLLADSDAARRGRYTLVVKVWVATDGHVERFELQGATGDPKADDALRHALSGLKLSDAPPEDMPQPVRLRIVSR